MERGATRRLAHEYAALQRESADELVTELAPQSDDLRSWRAVLRPPASGVYGGGRFELAIDVPDAYPIKPPSMRFHTHVFHPNVHWKVREPATCD